MTELNLGGYPARKCPRVVHNENMPDKPEPADPPAQLLQLFDAGRAFESDVIESLRDVLGSRGTFLTEADGSWTANVDATMAAMRHGDEVIVGGRLPSVMGRAGAPDVLVRTDTDPSSPVYVPVDIKNHHTTKEAKRGTLPHSSLSQPTSRESSPGRSNRGSHWRNDVMQLAHYTRMLQDLGFHPGDDWLWGGIIGTETSDDQGERWYGITWYDLTQPGEKTFSTSDESGRRMRTPLERYDHEFAFRLKVAKAARDGQELVRPIGTDECFTCVWASYCEQIVGPDDAGFALSHGRLRTREWQYLASRGVTTLQDLASLEVDADLLAGFVRHADTRQGPGKATEALHAAITKARMTVADVDIEPVGDTWPVVPTADVEVDFDIEWDRAGRIYQYGFRVRQGTDDITATYDPVVSFEPLDDDGAAALATEAADKLAALISDAEQDGFSLTIYHWTHPEVSKTGKFDDLASLLAGRTLDLQGWVQKEFVARSSFSLKDVAPIFDFQWGVDDAGGFASMDQIEHARRSGPEAEAARAWCLTYNEADVAAQAAIRDGLRLKAQQSHEAKGDFGGVTLA
ncbi:ribonuclease H-like domain-containing protein [Ornithinimicrobium cryptoxanthini]|uniref:ribonuclease H-like domain-containing protein n=1 Tax=Ornithinimicrobium cryptoxanthini TaxID=2934161 RepID=UPI0021179503|nr:ribonuclease H-like domain-containing protein [Ornithinimicrobium cryptoxanthini]